ncbi:hypothetical protein H5P28_19000 [Ruficoccus amylovorans]|uniref:SH3 domain-containing protein n=1 Tax=Ruficoccus amylovorans TaxID=1804625 RepID=A0A842HMP9_9BACT|nr:hypothetical protein [Ruficoccus amylovorans]MBC2596361.1 hypothetical protein [Ruficoccus amylovorans]
MRSLIAILSLLAAVTLQAQPAVNLYLEPEDNGVVFKTAPLAEVEALGPEHPVINGTVDNNWYRIAYPGQYVGFVEIPNTNADGTFNPGAPLFIRKSTSSGIIIRIPYGANAKVIDRSGNWATVSYRGEGHVYYKNPALFPPLPSMPPARAATTAGATTQRAASTPAAASSAPGVAVSTIPVGQTSGSMAVSTIPVTQEGGEIIAVEELELLEPLPAKQTPPPAARTTAPAPAKTAAPAPVVAQPQRPKAPPPGYMPVATTSSPQSQILSREVPHLYEGVFTRVRGFSFDFFGPDYAYALQDRSGKRIAYVDIENALLVSPIEAYLDKPVTVEGLPEKIGGTVPILIKAKFIRLNRY